MKISNRLELKVVILEIRDNGIVGDCFDSFDEFEKKCPDGNYEFAYVIYNTELGAIVPKSADWYDTPESALQDYLKNIR